MKPTAQDLRAAKDTVRDWADSFSDVSWQDSDTLSIYHLPRELDATDLIDRIASMRASEREKAAKIGDKLGEDYGLTAEQYFAERDHSNARLMLGWSNGAQSVAAAIRAGDKE